MSPHSYEHLPSPFAVDTMAAVRALGEGINAAITMRDGEAHLDLIAVAVPLRGTGLGSAALKTVLERADAAGLPVVVEPNNGFGCELGRLISWYGRYGFSPTGATAPFTMRRLPRMDVVTETDLGASHD
ncbi:GNAT family N-acetyltransferase [Frigoribacterium sp. SL97]|uniref:GNAT family N-acetyltransferase n=1 Tax=Frigoribacterium sp. SL97 TaxID=2994664 RepID=UPI0022707525|nr:GNAT family N-acetyltransferase [Frigoribacterium sp. SL97]WAC50432.1 hypothetical protein OVA02_11175 [Frigoribacterium sp. SL97]